MLSADCTPAVDRTCSAKLLNQFLTNCSGCRAPFIATGCAALLAALYGLIRLPETRLWKEEEQQAEQQQQQQQQQLQQEQQRQHSLATSSTDQLSSAPAGATEQAAAAAPAEK